jgi:hypothetical protein
VGGSDSFVDEIQVPEAVCEDQLCKVNGGARLHIWGLIKNIIKYRIIMLFEITGSDGFASTI